MPTPTLTAGRPLVTQQLRAQFVEGQRLLTAPVTDRVELAKLAQEKAAWSLRNRQLLYRIFDDKSGISGYRVMKPLSAHASLPLQLEHVREETRSQLACLRHVLEQTG